MSGAPSAAALRSQHTLRDPHAERHPLLGLETDALPALLCLQG